PTSTTLAVEGPPTAGSELRLTAEVEPAEASGTITFLDGQTELASVELVDGTATATATLGSGSHSLTAAFAPDSAAWEASVSAPVALEVGQSASATSLSVSRLLGSYGDTTTATVTVTGQTAAPAGPVEIHAGGEVVATG